MKAFNDYVIVKVDSELETFAGLIKDENGNEIRLILNPNFRPTHNAKICARVISVPKHLTGKNSPLYEIGPGYPKPSSYRGATHILNVLKNIPRKYRAKTVIPYRCGMYEPKMQTHKGLKIDVQPNDTVYFHYNMLLNEHNYLFRDPSDGFLVYKIPYTSLFCRVRNRKITMLNSFVLVSEVPDEDVVEVEVDGKAIKGKLEDKLLVPGDQPVYLSGILRHIGEGIGPYTRDIKPGTHIVFRPSSEFVNMIEDEAFYVMRQWDIIASWFPDEEIERMKEDPVFSEIFGRNHWIHPEGDYVMVRPNKIDPGGVIAYDPSNPGQFSAPGEIFVPAESLRDNRKGKIFSYGVGKVVDSGNLCVDGKEIFYEKGSHYVYIDDYDLAFVRADNIYGESVPVS